MYSVQRGTRYILYFLEATRALGLAISNAPSISGSSTRRSMHMAPKAGSSPFDTASASATMRQSRCITEALLPMEPATRWLPQVGLFAVAKRGLGYEHFAKRRKAHLRQTAHPTPKAFASKPPCPPSRLRRLSRLTKGVVGGSFTLNTRIAFGDGCDCPSYVAPVYSRRVPQGQLLATDVPTSTRGHGQIGWFTVLREI